MLAQDSLLSNTPLQAVYLAVYLQISSPTVGFQITNLNLSTPTFQNISEW